MLQERWQLSKDGRTWTCKEHPTVAPFLRLETCPICANEPVSPPTGEVEYGEDPEDIVAEVEVRELTKLVKGKADALAATAKERATAAKFYDVYLKAMRLWRELREPRLARRHDRYLCEHQKLMKGLRGRGSN